MRALISIVSLIAAVLILNWQVPQLVPQPVRGIIARAQNQIAGAAAATASSFTRPASAPQAEARGLLPSGWMLLAAGGGAALMVAAAFALRARRTQQREESPAWLTAARSLARSTSDSRSRLQQCDQIEKRLIADMRKRGAAALARAHQLDLYWRYIGRCNLMSKPITKSAELERWRDVTRQTLDSLTVAPAAQTGTVFHQMEPALWALDSGDARELRRYYGQVSELYIEHERAWNMARDAADQPLLDQSRLLDAMETLRQINRAIAKETAALVGDIEIKVRALS